MLAVLLEQQTMNLTQKWLLPFNAEAKMRGDAAACAAESDAEEAKATSWPLSICCHLTFFFTCVEP